MTVDGAILRADLRNQDIILRPQPICSGGEPYDGSFVLLPSENGESPASFNDNYIASVASFLAYQNGRA